MPECIKTNIFAFESIAIVSIFGNTREFWILVFYSRWNALTVTLQPRRTCFTLRQKMCQPHFQKVTRGYTQPSRGEASPTENIWEWCKRWETRLLFPPLRLIWYTKQTAFFVIEHHIFSWGELAGVSSLNKQRKEDPVKNPENHHKRRMCVDVRGVMHLLLAKYLQLKIESYSLFCLGSLSFNSWNIRCSMTNNAIC